jgi:circadian clock protein KaiB
LKNLESLCQRHIGDDFELDVVDVLQEPLRALNEGIFVTPTLIRLAPGPREILIGDLSEEAAVLRTLGLTSRDTA